MMTGIDTRSRKSLETWLAGWMAGALGMDAAAIDASKPFLSYGMDSIQSMMLVGDLETGLGRTLPPTLAWDHPSIEALAEHLFGLDEATQASGVAANGTGPLAGTEPDVG